MQPYNLSPAAQRVLEKAGERARRRAAAQVQPLDMLAGIACEPESRGASLLTGSGLDLAELQARLDKLSEPVEPVEPASDRPALSETVRDVMERAGAGQAEAAADQPAGTDALLRELLTAVPTLAELLAECGSDAAALRKSLQETVMGRRQPLATGFQRLELPDKTESADLYALLEAAVRRASQSLALLGDYARFVRGDRFVATELAELAERLDRVLERFGGRAILAARRRDGPADWESRPLATRAAEVAGRHWAQAAQSLAALQQFAPAAGLVVTGELAAIRRRLAELERAVSVAEDSGHRLDGVLLYLIVSTEGCQGELEWTVREALAGGAQMVQLREKGLADSQLLPLARRLRRWTRQAGALFIVNDRPELARLADADGVHLGQDDLPVQEARRIVGNTALVGVSAHSIEQARRAVLDGASYIGVGPTFPSRTKRFDHFPGLDLVRQVEAEIELPHFVIGGIDLTRLGAVLAAGGRRVAVSAAICGAEEPRAAAAAFRQHLEKARRTRSLHEGR